MSISIFDLLYLKPESDSEKPMARVVATVVKNIQHFRPIACERQAAALGLGIVPMRDICRSWARTVFASISNIMYKVHHAGQVSKSHIRSLLPALDGCTVARIFCVHDRGDTKKTRLQLPRQKAFALGLFRRHWVRPLAEKIQRDFGLSFEGRVDCKAFEGVYRQSQVPPSHPY